MFGAGAALVLILVLIVVTGAIAVTNLIEICEPNEVLIFSGSASEGKGYEIIHGARKVRIPLIHKVDRLDVTNMPIDINVSNAYSKGGIPLTVQGVANIKVPGEEPLIHASLERFLGKTRGEHADWLEHRIETFLDAPADFDLPAVPAEALPPGGPIGYGPYETCWHCE